MDDLVIEFLTETNESIAELDNDLVKLEQNPSDTDLLSGIFRLMHTIKGTCGFIGLSRLEKVAHKAEDVLGRFREGELEVTAEYMTLIFESLDAIKFILAAIEETGEEPAGDDGELIAKLEAAYAGKSLDDAGNVDGDAGAAPDESSKVSAEDLADAVAAAKQEASGDKVAPENALNNVLNILEDGVEEEDGAAAQDVEFEPVPAPEKAPEKAPAAEKAPAKPATPPAAASAAPAQKKEPALSTQTLRVNVDVLEDLMTMVSELVLTRNQLMQIMRTQRESDFSAPLQNLNQVVSELQDGVMKTRMQPIGNAWSKLPRIIRDITLELGKKIDLQMLGQETELDRQVLDMIKDPLTHMVRNSADHGIEAPADRLAVGKPEIGKIVLNAYHEGGHIIIEIKDDGKGLPLSKIKQKILDNGLASEEELEKMSSHQIQQYIFKAGFSTAEKVTSVSGRGVGMDVVRSNIENIGGSVELNSVEGKGTTFFIKIPLTLAIVSALIVAVADEKFAIPQLSVRELVMATEHGKSRIEMIKGTPVFRLRDHLLPLVSLRELLKLKTSGGAPSLTDLANASKGNSSLSTDNVDSADSADKGEGSGQDNEGEKVKSNALGNEISENSYIVVTQVGSYQFGIIVDQVYDTEEIVVKPVSKILKDIDLFSGNTILGDGSVIMILDPAGIAKTTGNVEGSESADQKSEVISSEQNRRSKTSLLLFSAGDKTPKAVPLALVARLENIKVDEVEYAEDQMLIQYRGKLMPLTPMSHSVSMQDQKEKPVLVFSTEDKSMGLVVDEILDILEEHIDVQYSAERMGVIGSAIINGKATDIIDVSYYVRKSDKDWFMHEGEGDFEDGKSATIGHKRRVLLVDDSPFFRNMMTPLLNVAGYEVTTQESAVDALEMLERGEVFDVIVSDIEMPEMSGFEFAEKVRSNADIRKTPLVALSSHATSADISRGQQAGFQKYVAKFDRDTLISTINETVASCIDENESENANAGEVLA